MGAIDLHPSAVVYDHSYYPKGSTRTSASPNRGHPHHCCYNLTRLKFWPLTWFQFRTARAPNRRDSTRITSWITTRIPSKLEGHQKSWKKTAPWFKLLGLEKNTEKLTAKPWVGLGSWNWGRSKRNSVWISPVSGSCNPRMWNCQEHRNKGYKKRMA